MPGRPFDSKTGREASMNSPWRNVPACPTNNARNIRRALDADWSTSDPATEQTIGVAMMPSPPFSVIRNFLISAGWQPGEIIQIHHPNDAAMVRQAGGLVVHIETAERPHLVGHISSAGLDVHEGDFVLTGATDPGEYLPRLLGRLSRLARSDDR